MHDCWECLFLKLPKAEPFARVQWFKSYSHAFERGAAHEILTVRKGEEMQAVLPFVRKSSCFGGVPGRTLRSLSGKHSCRFDVVVADAHQMEALSSVWRALTTNSDWDVIEAQDVPQGGAFEQLVFFAKSEGYLVAKWPTLFSPYLRIPIDGTDPYAHCLAHYKKTRHRLKKSLQRLETRGNVTFEVTCSDPRAALQRFITLEASGWKGAKGSAIGSAAPTREFYTEVCDTLATTGSLRIYTSWLDQTPIAMELGLIEGSSYFSPKATYDESFSAFSPGHLLTHHIIGDLAHLGVKRYDFLGPKARYKMIWASNVRPHATYRIFRPSCAGRVRYLLVDKIAPLLRQTKRAIRGDPQE
jgi:CelD/BcsL family acetyltransferase involved in cellulose biosynthesis